MIVMETIEEQARAAYAEVVVNGLTGPEFQKIMAVDGCFFLLLAFSVLGAGTMLKFPENHLVFGTGCVNEYMGVWFDSMFFVGNQIPFIVLKKLMELSYFKGLKTTLTCKWQQLELGKRTLQKFLIVDQNPKPMDLIHCLQSIMLGPRGSSNIAVGKKKDDTGEIVSVSRLSKRGIKFQKLGGELGIRAMHYECNIFRAVLSLPILKIDRFTGMLVRCLLKYDMVHQHQGIEPETCSFFKFMRQLIRTAQDVEVLESEGKSKDDLKIISICGMGGIGKTTLARTVYQDCSVRHHFDCLAWATVGKSFRTRNVLEDLLLQLVFPTRDDMAPFSALDLAQKLYEFLQPKRYLIVLDDLWSTDAWDCLRIAFPSRETTGSRVLLTTRDTLVADKISSSAHHMRTLNQDEAWELLRKKALRDSKAHTELLEIGKDIAKGCQGLPLAITVMAGLLASKPTLHKWKMVHQSFVSYQTIDLGPQDSSKVNPILALSYNFLPQPLKPRFLYLGAVFPEDAEIDAESLYRLWLAEGFIPSTLGSGRLSVMDIAERYLNELVTRSLVLLHKREFSKFMGSKSCRVHDVL